MQRVGVEECETVFELMSVGLHWSSGSMLLLNPAVSVMSCISMEL